MNVVRRTLPALAGAATAALMLLPIPAEARLAGLPGPIAAVGAADGDTPPSPEGEPSVSPQVRADEVAPSDSPAPSEPDPSAAVESSAPAVSMSPSPDRPRTFAPEASPAALPSAGHARPKRIRPSKPVLSHAARVRAEAATPAPTPTPLTPPAGLTPPESLPAPSGLAPPADLTPPAALGVTPLASPPPALPEIAPRPAPSAPSPHKDGISELTMLTPTGALQAGRVSWATVIAVAIVAEAGVLWLATGLTVWRRKKARGRPSRQTRLARVLRSLR